MSGGSFDYAYSRVSQFADELQQEIENNDTPDKYGCCPSLLPDTIAKLKEIETLARKTSALMREAEWLYSADTSDDSFMERVAKIEVEYQ